MAAVSEAVELCGLSNASEFLYISSSFENECILVSCRNGQVYLYQIQDQKVISSWSCRHNTELTGGVVQLEEDRYACIVNEKILRTWNKDELLIDKGKKTTLKKRAHCICADRSHPPLVLFSDGSLTSLGEAKEHDKDGPLSNTDNIVWYSLVHYHEDNGCLAVLVKEQNNNHKLLVHWLQWEDNSVKSSHLLVNLENSVAGQLLSWDTYYSSDGKLSLFTLVSEANSDPSYHLKRLVFMKDSHVSKCECICLFQEATATPALVMVGESHAIVAGLQDQELSLKKESFGLIDIKFAAVQKRIPFPSSCSRLLKTYKANNYIIATDGKIAWALPYTSGPSRLGDLFGKFSPKVSNTPSISNLWQDSKSSNKDDAHMKTIEETVMRLSDRSKTHSLKIFSQEFEKFMSLLHKSSTQPVNAASVVVRCLEEREFWPRSEVKELITSGLIPTGCYDALVSRLVGNEDLNLLLLCLDNLREIPETVLAAILQCFLRTEETQFANSMKTSGIDHESLLYFKFHKASALNKILVQPFNDVFLLECLKAMKFEEVKKLVNYLASIVHGSDSIPESNMQLPSITQAQHRSVATTAGKVRAVVTPIRFTGTGVASVNRMGVLVTFLVVDWINLCLDAHFTQWCLSTDTRELLLNLAQTSEAKQKFYDQLQSLDAILTQLKKKCDLPKKKIGQYCITTLNM